MWHRYRDHHYVCWWLFASFASTILERCQRVEESPACDIKSSFAQCPIWYHHVNLQPTHSRLKRDGYLVVVCHLQSGDDSFSHVLWGIQTILISLLTCIDKRSHSRTTCAKVCIHCCSQCTSKSTNIWCSLVSSHAT